MVELLHVTERWFPRRIRNVSLLICNDILVGIVIFYMHFRDSIWLCMTCMPDKSVKFLCKSLLDSIVDCVLCRDIELINLSESKLLVLILVLAVARVLAFKLDLQ